MLKTIWDQFLVIAQEEAGSRVVETWLKAVILESWDPINKILRIKAPNAFVREWIKSNYLDFFHLHLNRLLHVDKFKIIFLDAHQAAHDSVSTAIKIVPAQRLEHTAVKKDPKFVKPVQVRHHLNKNFIFDTFVVGPHNHMAYAAAYAITQKLGKLYNPLFIYGDSGLGKTHLLHAIAHEAKVTHKNIDVLYQPADRFVGEFIHAIRFDKIHHFQAKYKSIDVLLIDDVQCISNKEQTQEAFFHIFNALYDADKQIIFSGDSYPSDMQGIAERLRSRLASGLVVDVQPPAIETKIAILKKKAELHQQELQDDVAHFIAAQSSHNIRELEGAFIRVNAFAELTKQKISLELVKKVLARNTSSFSGATTVDFEKIIKIIAGQFSYTLQDLRSKKRSKELSWARQLAMYFMRKLTDRSLQEIALYLGRSDHSTVIHAFKQVQDRLEIDQVLSNQLQKMHQEMLY